MFVCIHGFLVVVVFDGIPGLFAKSFSKLCFGNYSGHIIIIRYTVTIHYILQIIRLKF